MLDREARDTIVANYRVDARGTIRSPGKFEGEMLYVPHYWDCVLDGAADEDAGREAFFRVTDADRQLFPELGAIYGLSLRESDQGFVDCEEYDTAAEYDAAVTAAEAESSGDDDMGDDAEPGED